MSSAERAASVTFYSQPPCTPPFPKKLWVARFIASVAGQGVENVSYGTEQRTTVDGELNSHDDIQCASVAAAAAHAVVVRLILHPPVCLSVCVCVRVAEWTPRPTETETRLSDAES